MAMKREMSNPFFFFLCVYQTKQIKINLAHDQEEKIFKEPDKEHIDIYNKNEDE